MPPLFSRSFPNNLSRLSIPGFFRALFGKEKELARIIKNILGFYPCNIYLYHLALRHRSAAVEIAEGKKISNERLEYLGDAILGAVIADYLFFKYPFKDEGFLTQMRSKFVSRNHLNKLSLKLGIDKMIKTDADSTNNYRSMGGDALEALIGAIYVDRGFDFTRHIIIDRIIRLHIDLEELQNKELNYKSKLIEYIQKEKLNLEFRVQDEVGKGYSKQYVVEVFVDNVSYGTGMGHSIKVAEQVAAEIACATLCNEPELPK
jgi:ribonuclease III